MIPNLETEGAIDVDVQSPPSSPSVSPPLSPRSESLSDQGERGIDRAQYRGVKGFFAPVKRKSAKIPISAKTMDYVSKFAAWRCGMYEGGKFNPSLIDRLSKRKLKAEDFVSVHRQIKIPVPLHYPLEQYQLQKYLSDELVIEMINKAKSVIGSDLSASYSLRVNFYRPETADQSALLPVLVTFPSHPINLLLCSESFILIDWM